MTKHGHTLNCVGLFAGIGGLEKGLERAGHATLGLCEIEQSAKTVLEERFPDVPIWDDVTRLSELPPGTDLVTAGFPCQDLSQAGRTAGITGERSGLVDHVFRLSDLHDTPWLLLENVSFMLHLAGGNALGHILDRIEGQGYKWAYRVVDSRAFGVPQRRQRVFLLASHAGDPRDVLLSDDAGEPESMSAEGRACGFYWTEGVRGLGWAVDAIPTLKGGSTVGIPSSPAIVLPNGMVVKPGIRDGERLQGFEPDYTLPAQRVAKRGMRWKLVGNAVTVDAAEWIGHRLADPIPYDGVSDAKIDSGRPWPKAAYNVGGGRFESHASAWPLHNPAPPLAEFLNMEEVEPLSARATAGFLKRFEASTLRRPKGFVEALHLHLQRMQSTLVCA